MKLSTVAIISFCQFFAFNSYADKFKDDSYGNIQERIKRIRTTLGKVSNEVVIRKDDYAQPYDFNSISKDVCDKYKKVLNKYNRYLDYAYVVNDDVKLDSHNIITCIFAGYRSENSSYDSRELFKASVDTFYSASPVRELTAEEKEETILENERKNKIKQHDSLYSKRAKSRCISYINDLKLRYAIERIMLRTSSGTDKIVFCSFTLGYPAEYGQERIVSLSLVGNYSNNIYKLQFR